MMTTTFQPETSAAPGAGKDWREQAACLGTDPEIFFPTRGDGGQQAMRICKGCPVLEQCFEAVMAEESGGFYHRHGIRGGTTPRRRARIAADAQQPRGA